LDENEEAMNSRMLVLSSAARLSVLSGTFLLSLYICADIAGLVRKAQAQTAPPDAIQEDGQWPMPAKDYANTRYSGLTDITTENVKQLKPAWTFSTGVNHGPEAAPLVVSDTMYPVTCPNILYALDLTQPGAPPKV
jgi:alcohol dehydrogenase (cytochrome c)